MFFQCWSHVSFIPTVIWRWNYDPDLLSEQDAIFYYLLNLTVKFSGFLEILFRFCRGLWYLKYYSPFYRPSFHNLSWGLFSDPYW